MEISLGSSLIESSLGSSVIRSSLESLALSIVRSHIFLFSSFSGMVSFRIFGPFQGPP